MSVGDTQPTHAALRSLTANTPGTRPERFTTAEFWDLNQDVDASSPTY